MITVFGVIWSIIIIYCFKKVNINYMFFFTLFFMTFQCSNVIMLNADKGVGPQVLTSICFIVKFFMSSKWKISRFKCDKSMLASIALVAVMLVIMVSGVINRNLSDIAIVIVQLAIYFFTFFLMKRAARDIDNRQIYRYVRSIIIFVVAIGLLQWFITMFFPAGRTLMKILFYNDNSTDVYFNYTDQFHNRRIYSTFMEPSYMSAFAVSSFFYLICFWNRIKENILLLCLLAFIVIISFSSTAYGALAVTGVLFIFSTKEMNNKWKLLIFAAAVFVMVFFFVFFYGVLEEVIFQKATTGSAITRARWNKEAYEAFLSSPIIGMGYKSIRGSSIVYSLMGQIGILGLLSFFAFNIFSFWRVFFRLKNQYSEGFYGSMYAVIASLICMIIACPDLDLCSYWCWLYILAAYNGRELVKYKKIKILTYRCADQNRLELNELNCRG